MAALLVPTAAQCLQLGGPALLIVGTIWFWRNGEVFLERLFPGWEWERQLGWLNLRADRQAGHILCAFTHLLHAALLLALVGILLLSRQLGEPADTESFLGVFSLAGLWINLIACYGFWIYYFVAILAPRVREEYEAGELERYRIENPEFVKEDQAGDPFKVSVWDSTRPRRF